MKLTLIRKVFTETSTIGELSIDGQFFCYTLEDTVREIANVPVSSWKIKGATAIPKGTYDVQITFSNRFQQNMPLLVNVPGFDGIRIHPGNTALDTDGCVLVGMLKMADFIGDSRKAYNQLLPLIQAAINRKESVKITVQ